MVEKRLRNPPLVEALLELRWKLGEQPVPGPPADPGYPIIVGLLYERVKKRYPYVEDLPQAHLPPELLQHSVAHRFRVASGVWPLVQIGPGIASLNYTAPYSWRQFRMAAKRLLDDLKSAYEVVAGTPPQIEQVTLRYINAVALESDSVDALRFLNEQMHVSLVFPTPVATAGVTATPANLRFQVVYEVTQPEGLAVLSLGTGEKQERPAVVWDLSVVSSEDQIPEYASLPEWLSRAHKVVEDWFFRLIEGALYHRFQEGG